MEFLPERQAKDAILAACTSSQQASFAVAFWGRGAAAELGIADRARRGLSTTVVCNLVHGGTNPEEIEDLLRLGVHVRQCDLLHAKVYLFDSWSLVGSSNASANGLAFQAKEADGWIEANLGLSDAPTLKNLRTWFDGLETRDISLLDLKRAKLAWQSRRSAGRLDPVAGLSLYEAISRGEEFFEGRNLFLVAYTQDMNRVGEEALEAAQAEFGSHVDAFQDWSDLPDDALLVAFRLGPRGGILSFHGILRRRPEIPDRPLEDGTELQLCWPVGDAQGLQVFFGRERSGWRALLGWLRESPAWEEEGQCGFVNIAEVARAAQKGDIWL